MTATLDQLVKVRSWKVDDMLAYLQAMEAELSKNPLLDRFGRSLDELWVPLRVVPYEPVRDIEEVRAREHLRQTGASGDGDDADKVARRVWAFRGTPFDDEQPSRPRPERLDELEPRLEMAVLLGDPGSGKTEWLKYRARRAAREAWEQLDQFTVRLDDLSFPAYLRLSEVATVLKEESQLKDLLVETGCVPSHPAVLSDARLAAAALIKAMVQHHKLPERLAPWVWAKLTAQRQAAMGGSLLLCLDAWDEVRGGEEELKTFSRCLNAFARETPARLFLTSRILGYAYRPLPMENRAEGPRRELQICPFEWGETEAFVIDFFLKDPERGRKMLAELRGKIAVAGMAQNPLLTTLLCLAFSPRSDRRRLGFPARRVEVEAAARAPRVLPALLEALHDENAGVCKYAAWALGRIGEAAARDPQVLPALLDVALLHDEDERVRRQAARALRRVMARGIRISQREHQEVEWKTVEELANR